MTGGDEPERRVERLVNTLDRVAKRLEIEF
jgi:hypothetical protein